MKPLMARVVFSRIGPLLVCPYAENLSFPTLPVPLTMGGGKRGGLGTGGDAQHHLGAHREVIADSRRTQRMPQPGVGEALL